MLNRIIYKEPTPIKPAAKDPFIFNKEGQVRGYFVKLCNEIHIDPLELYPKNLEDFSAKGKNRNIQILKHNDFENKRRSRIEALKQIARHRYGINQKTNLRLDFKGGLLISNLENLASVSKEEKPAKEFVIKNPVVHEMPNPQLFKRHTLISDEQKNIILDMRGFNDVGGGGVKRLPSTDAQAKHFRSNTQNDNDLKNMSGINFRSKGFDEGFKVERKNSDDLQIKRKTSSFSKDLLDDKKFKGRRDSKFGTGITELDLIKTNKNVTYTSKDVSTISSDEDDNFSIAEVMEENYQRYLAAKSVHKERMQQAAKRSQLLEKEFVENSRKKLELKQKKYEEASKRRDIKSAKKASDNDIDYYIPDPHEKFAEITQKDQDNRRKQLKNLFEKINSAEKRRESNSQSRIQKIQQVNNSFRRSSNVVKTEPADNTSLDSIENRLNQSQRNRDRLKLEKAIHLQKYGTNIEQKRKQVKQKEEMYQSFLIHSTVEKIQKMNNSVKSPNRLKSREGSISDGDYTRYEWRGHTEPDKSFDDKLKILKEKDKKREQIIKNRKRDITNYIDERREAIKQKFESVKENNKINQEAEEKKLGKKLQAFYDRNKKIQNMRALRFKQLKETSKDFNSKSFSKDGIQ